MSESWSFRTIDHKVKVTNSWFFGVKLYIDGKLSDKDTSFLDFGEEALTAKLANGMLLEVIPKPGLVSVQMDAYLVEDEQRRLVFSSYQPTALIDHEISS